MYILFSDDPRCEVKYGSLKMTTKPTINKIKSNEKVTMPFSSEVQEWSKPSSWGGGDRRQLQLNVIELILFVQ